MRTAEHTMGQATVLSLNGRLDGRSAPEVEREVRALMGRGVRNLVLDLSGVEYLSSAGLRVFLTAAKQLQQAAGKLVLGAPGDQVSEVLKAAGFATIVPVHGSVALACAEFEEKPGSAAEEQSRLNFAEELYLLALDDHKGVLKAMPPFALRYALAGALLMELSLANRIETDADHVHVTCADMTGDPLLDELLGEVCAESGEHPVEVWLKRFSTLSREMERRVLKGLIAKGILREEDRRLMWVFEVRRYPMVDDREIKEVRSRLREVILSRDIPDPRDIVLISLGNACRLLDELFAPVEIEEAKDRINAIAQLDLIGQKMSEAIRDIEVAMVSKTMPLM